MIFGPIFDAVAASQRTMYAHIADSPDSWRPLDPTSLHYSYLKGMPAWYMHRHPERPSKQTILDARDRMLANHPQLKFVGCHLGSTEDDVDEIAKRLDRYPNFAVDTAARVADLMNQDREKVRAFLLKYSDRVLYGTDLSLSASDETAKAIRQMEETYARDWKYFATEETIKYRKLTAKGLGLPKPVLRKIFYENAVKWVPGLVPAR
jgi:predicted TIM-barrel fold metal-dependent hydrolase